MFKPSMLSLAIAACCFSVSAQTETTTENDSIEKIEVTGSRLKGVDLEGAQPLVVISSDDIKKSGANTIFDLLKDVGQLRGGEGTFSTSESGATSTSTPAGQAAASLRGLGPASTLTLINGRRVAASSFAAGTQNFVDVNSIPLAAVERIEVLATGASAVYGADAVAGVINYILKKDYEGVELNASYGDSMASSDESRRNLNLVVGQQVAGGQLTVFADYFDRNAFSAQDRDFTRSPLLQSSYSYLPKNTPNIYYRSVRSGDELATPGCATALVTTEFGEEICAYYPNEDDQLNSDLTSYSTGAIFQKDFGDISWNTDVFFSNTKSVAISSPAPINKLDDSEGPYVDESALDVFEPAIRDELLDQLRISRFETLAGRELRGFAFDARFGTPRTVEVETDALRLVSALSGSIGDWGWESAVIYSESKSDQLATQGIYNRYKYHAALAGELCSNGSIASYDADNDSLSCSSGSLGAMYNPFLQNDSNNDTLLALAQEMPSRKGKSTVVGWDARFNGDLMEFNDGVISSAFGLEVRKEKITDTPSDNAVARAENGYLVDVFGFGSSLSAAERTQWAAFSEFNVPLASTLDMQLAARYDHFDDFGSTFNPKIGFSYRPIEELIVRASYATSFRAPSLTQAGVKLRTTTASFDCGANQAVADLFCEGFGDERSGNNVLELGNPQLQAEESDSISLGFALSLTEDSTLTVDYWRFEHENLVDTNMTGVLARAIGDASLRHCGLVPAGAQGISFDEELCDVTDNAGLNITQDGANMAEILDEWVTLDNPLYKELPLYRDHVLLLDNTGEQTVSGIDLAYDHRFNTEIGTFGLSLDATRYLSFERNKAGSDEIEELIGSWRYPETVAGVRFSWSKGDFFSSISANYTDSYEDDISGLRRRELSELDDLGVLNAEGTRQVSSWTTWRMNLGYDFAQTTISFNIDNLLDRDPPAAYGSSRGFDSINHDALGRSFRIALSHKF